MDDMQKTTLYLPIGLRRRLRDQARFTGRPQAELVREALDRYLDQRRPPLPTSIGAGDDPALDAREAKGWVHQRWSDEKP